MDHIKTARRLAAHNPLRDMGMRSYALTRRRLLQGIAAGTAFAAAGGPALAQERDLALLTWDAYADPRLLNLWRDGGNGGIRYEIHISDPTSVNRLRAGETNVWDFVNLNNPWARQQMWPEGLIRDLPRDRFEPLYEKMAAKFHPPYRWAMSTDGEHLLGLVQRYETFDFVVNSDVIAPATAKDLGWDLFNDPATRFGILAYEDWNVMDICLGAGIHPYREKSDADVAKFEATAKDWISRAKLVTTDFVQLNLAILNDEIDCYFTGGTYTTAAARMEGLSNLHAITPSRGPADGKGGINWIEVNSAVNNPAAHPKALDFLEWIATPEAAYIVANGNGNLQPVSQMADPAVLSKFSREQLDAMQFDELEERVANAIEFDIIPDYDRLYDIYAAAMRARG
jgi:spermidine/putrescine transport system substrate-binding protein